MNLFFDPVNPKDDKLDDKLILCFSDIDKNNVTEKEILFNEDHAKQIIDFLKKYWDHECIIFQYDGGISRSSAMAAAFHQMKGLSDMHIFKNKRPNMHVYRLLLNTYFNYLDMA